MKAVVYDRYGPPGVLRIQEVQRPAPRDDELLVRVRAATVNRLDCHTREANRTNGLVLSGVSRVVSGVRRPRRRILGTEFAGVVAAAGAAVTGFGAGDRVFGNTGLRFGCHAEFPVSRRRGAWRRCQAAWALRRRRPRPTARSTLCGACGWRGR